MNEIDLPKQYISDIYLNASVMQNASSYGIFKAWYYLFDKKTHMSRYSESGLYFNTREDVSHTYVVEDYWISK